MQKELFVHNPILKLSFDFSLLVIDYCENLHAVRKFIIANQLLKSATSIGANAMEAQSAESKDDFIHKMKVSAKEAEETQYWLMLCEYSPNYPECKTLIMKLEEIHKILGKILSTSKKK
ncbi:four helix bundle protein [Niastella caeni]|uniref:Four helix bundle protein n=1 Tax=Niastella caeni TaxID=2569763 RepID=A0A4S8HGY9_9BACT|nr:four helix bundle protein [Niastella caeni]THU33429.1 four helix bundle protein [Niastella caeni]